MGGEEATHQQEREVTVVTSYPKGATLFEWVSGGIGASFFPFVYIFAPFYLIFALISLPAVLLLHVQWSTAALIWLPLVLSAMVPPIGSNSCLQSWPFKYFPAYFEYSEIAEISDPELKELMRTKRVMFVAQPHGVFTFAGATAIVSWGRRFWDPETCPTVSDESLLHHLCCNGAPFIPEGIRKAASCPGSRVTPPAVRLVSSTGRGLRPHVVPVYQKHRGNLWFG